MFKCCDCGQDRYEPDQVGAMTSTVFGSLKICTFCFYKPKAEPGKTQERMPQTTEWLKKKIKDLQGEVNDLKVYATGCERKAHAAEKILKKYHDYDAEQIRVAAEKGIAHPDLAKLTAMDLVLKLQNELRKVNAENKSLRTARSPSATEKYVQYLESTIRRAYEQNQNMHCFSTTGCLKDELNEQTKLLREAIQRVPTCPAMIAEGNCICYHSSEGGEAKAGADISKGDWVVAVPGETYRAEKAVIEAARDHLSQSECYCLTGEESRAMPICEHCRLKAALSALDAQVKDAK